MLGLLSLNLAKRIVGTKLKEDYVLAQQRVVWFIMCSIIIILLGLRTPLLHVPHTSARNLRKESHKNVYLCRRFPFRLRSMRHSLDKKHCLDLLACSRSKNRM